LALAISDRFDLTLPNHLLKKTMTKRGFSDLPSAPAFRGTKVFKRIITATFLTIIGLSVMTPAVAQNAVIIVFDVDRAISLSKAGKSMAEQLESQIQKVRTDETEVLKSLQARPRKLKEQQKLLAPEALQKKVEELRLKEVERRRSLNEKSQSIQAGGQKACREDCENCRRKNSPPSPKSVKPILCCAAKHCSTPARPSMSRPNWWPASISACPASRSRP
jgi:Skp family chaperone for outer membrane proteins